MNCRKFHKNVADYVAGRLDAQQAVAMQNHAATCSECKRLEADEHHLRSAFQGVKRVPPVADLWPRLATQLSHSGSRRPLWSVQKRVLAMCGASLCFLVGIGIGTFVSNQNARSLNSLELLTSARATDQRVVTLVSDMREMPVAETDAIWAEDLPGHQVQREELTGGEK